MQPVNVQLPPGDLIKWGDLADAIGTALFPDVEHSDGISCIIGITIKTPSLEKPMPLKFDQGIAKILEPFLGKLPSLHDQMTEEEMALFLDAYRALPDRPAWEPQIISEAYRVREKKEIREYRRTAIAKHAEQISDYISAEGIRIFDKNYISKQYFSLETYFSREDAIRYLKEHHLRFYQKTDDDTSVKNTEERPLLCNDNKAIEEGCEIQSNNSSATVTIVPENQPSEITSIEVQQKNKNRSNALMRLIREAQDKCENSFDVNIVWPFLVEFARQQKDPFFEFTEDQKIKYRNSEGRVKCFVKSSLQLRLNRYEHSNSQRQSTTLTGKTMEPT